MSRDDRVTEHTMLGGTITLVSTVLAYLATDRRSAWTSRRFVPERSRGLGRGTVTARVVGRVMRAWKLVGGVITSVGLVLLGNPSAIAQTRAFCLTGSMEVARTEHTATFLALGKVLVAGGRHVPESDPSFASAELYDSTMGTWSPAGPMNTARRIHTATLLPNGKVLVAGGRGGPGESILASAELYDPAMGAWSPTGSMSTPRVFHTATLLPSGKSSWLGGGPTILA